MTSPTGTLHTARCPGVGPAPPEADETRAKDGPAEEVDMPITDAVTLVIADDDANVRAALHDLFAPRRDIEVVAEAASAQEAVAACAAHAPHVVLLDVGMPGDGLTAAGSITASQPSTKVVVLTAHDSPEVREGAATNGATRFVVKSDGDDLVRTVLDAAAAAAH